MSLKMKRLLKENYKEKSNVERTVLWRNLRECGMASGVALRCAVAVARNKIVNVNVGCVAHAAKFMHAI
jgi:hypothetical protein